MISRRRLGLAITAGLAALVMFAGASALAASSVTRTNYRGHARPAHAITITRTTNYRGQARTSARTVRVHGSNLPASNARR
jgi:hypothetical protein